MYSWLIFFIADVTVSFRGENPAQDIGVSKIAQFYSFIQYYTLPVSIDVLHNPLMELKYHFIMAPPMEYTSI